MIVQSVQHAAMYPHRIAIARMITRRTQHHPLSAPSDNPSHGYAMRVHGSMGVRKPVSRLPRADCSDQHSSTAAQSARGVSNGPLSIDHSRVLTMLTPSAMARSLLVAAESGLTDSR